MRTFIVAVVLLTLNIIEELYPNIGQVKIEHPFTMLILISLGFLMSIAQDIKELIK